jgi:hypothetical protein
VFGCTTEHRYSDSSWSGYQWWTSLQSYLTSAPYFSLYLRSPRNSFSFFGERLIACVAWGAACPLRVRVREENLSSWRDFPATHRLGLFSRLWVFARATSHRNTSASRSASGHR